MKTFVLGLKTGGLMEMPGWRVEMIQSVQANNLREAKAEWARVTGQDQYDTWNPERQTVWGWQIVEISA